jgi:zinc transporter 1/2/3
LFAGAVIGITSVSTSDSATLLQGCFNAVAAGSLLYSALVEMIAEDFSATELNDLPVVKAWMYSALALGAGSMALLAIYA